MVEEGNGGIEEEWVTSTYELELESPRQGQRQGQDNCRASDTGSSYLFVDDDVDSNTSLCSCLEHPVNTILLVFHRRSS